MLARGERLARAGSWERKHTVEINFQVMLFFFFFFFFFLRTFFEQGLGNQALDDDQNTMSLTMLPLLLLLHNDISQRHLDRLEKLDLFSPPNDR